LSPLFISAIESLQAPLTNQTSIGNIWGRPR
jgi:hypothetical protein